MSSNLTGIWSIVVQPRNTAPHKQTNKQKHQTATQNQTSTYPMDKFMIQQSNQKNLFKQF